MGEWLSSMYEALDSTLARCKAGVVVCAYNPGTEDVEVGGWLQV